MCKQCELELEALIQKTMGVIQDRHELDYKLAEQHQRHSARIAHAHVSLILGNGEGVFVPGVGLLIDQTARMEVPTADPDSLLHDLCTTWPGALEA